MDFIHILQKGFSIFLSSPVVASLSGVITGVLLYRQQKAIDRKQSQGDELTSLLIQAEKYINEVEGVVDKTVNTKKFIEHSGDSDESKQKRLRKTKQVLSDKYVPKLSDLINSKIVIIRDEIESKCKIFFDDDIEELDAFLAIMKEWHDCFLLGFHDGDIDFEKKVDDIDEIPNRKLSQALHNLISKVQEVS